MILERSIQVLNAFKSKLEEADDKYVLATAIFVVVLCSLFIFRLWSFTITPWLYPNKPKYLPYWIPGHAGAFFKDVNSLVTRARKHFPNPQEPFILNVAGEKLCVISSPSQVSEVFRNTSTFTFDSMVRTIHTAVATVSSEGLKTLWRTPAEGYNSLHGNPGNKVLAYRGADILHEQVLPGQHLEELTHRFLGHLETSTRWDSFTSKYTLASDESRKILSLHSWCMNILVDAATRAFYGDYLFELEPSLTQIFHQWDENSWMKTYQYPDFLAGPAVKPRNMLIRTFTKYLESSRERRGNAAYYVNAEEDEERHAGLSTKDSAKLTMLIYWAINSNAYKAAWWLLSMIVSNPSLLSSIRNETASTISPLTSAPITANSPIKIDHQHLVNSCPRLNAAFNETLRMSSTSASVREVLSPTEIGGVTLEAGMKIFVSQRQLLMDEEGFGPTAQDIDPDRFLKNKSLEKNGFYRPFGGGTTLCSGRFIARTEVLAFVATVLWRYDIETVAKGQRVLGVEGKPPPRLDIGKPSLGIASPKPGDDIIVTVRPRMF